ncbi:MAG: hypothetical protein II216_00770 [Alistipes sp.]|nr:hypothetical protein [Alistipes sp.]
MSLNLLQVAEPVMLEPEPGMTLSQTFMAGGWHFMALITLALICALFAAWKAPAWVKPLGKVAIAIGILSFLMGVQDMADCCAKVGSEIPFSVYCSGFKVALIAPIYSIIVYVIITIADTVRRPRI